MAYAIKDGNRVMVLQDCGVWWQDNKEPEHGKIFPLRHNDSEVHSIFFDANGATQVDSRDEHGEHVPLSEVIGTKVLLVDPLQAMVNDRYLIDLLERCEARRDADLPARAPSTTFGLTEVMD